MRYNLRFVALTSFLGLAGAAFHVPLQAQLPVPAASDPYARYVDAGQCVEGARRMEGRYWSDKHRDTARYAPEAETLPHFIRDSMALCALHFPVATTPAADLVPRLQLALLSADTAAERVIVARITSVLPKLTDSARTRLLSGTADTYMWAKPARYARAREYAAQLDRMGRIAAAARLNVHLWLTYHAWWLGESEQAERETVAALAASRELSPADQVDFAHSVADVYLLRGTIVGARHGPAAGLAVLDSASAALTAMLQESNPYVVGLQQRMKGAIESSRVPLTLVGTKAKAVRADWWLSTTGDTVFPKPGRVTLVFMYNPGFFNFEALATLRRLQADYAARGLDIVFLTHTVGYFGLEVNEPTQEAANWRRWYVDFLRVPFSVSLERTQFGRLADGRRRDSQTTNMQSYYGGSTTIVGKDGTIRFVLYLMPNSERVIRQQIESALAAP